MAKPWSIDEILWARECFFAGDSIAEIAEAAGRDHDDVAARLPLKAYRLTERNRQILSFYIAGSPLHAIAEELGLNTRNGKKCVAAAISEMRRRRFPIPHRIAMPGAVQ